MKYYIDLYNYQLVVVNAFSYRARDTCRILWKSITLFFKDIHMHYFGLKLAVCMLIQPDFNMTHETKIEKKAILSSEILNS